MSTAWSQQSFLANALVSSSHSSSASVHSRAHTRNILKLSVTTISCGYSNHDHTEESPSGIGNQLAKLAVVTVAAGILALGGPLTEASAAKTGGRVGGQAFRSPRTNNSRTKINVNPPVAPPLVGGYGYGYGYGVPIYGGWGWSPFSFFTPGPSVAVGVGGSFEVIALFMLLGAVATVVRRFLGSTDKDQDEDY